tara:strand:+ start:31786 stop:34719 length:2934 start_codon:yes stop_codon:yes gene_type:complete
MKLSKIQKIFLKWESDHAAKRRGGFWLTLLFQIVLFVAVELLRPKPEIEDAKPAGLGDFSFPTATEGRVIPLLWGTVRVDGPNVVWYGDLEQIAITEKVQTGMFSSERVTKGHQYEIGLQFAIARGPVDKILGLWIGDDKVWTGSVVHDGTFTVDDPELFGGEENGTGGFKGTMKFHSGTSTQTASSYLSTFQQQTGVTPAYRGTCYIAPSTENWWVGNSTTLKPWKFELQRIPNGLSLAGGIEVVNTLDANPANVIYEIMTNTEWGLGYAVADIDTTNFTTAATTLEAEGAGFSMLLTSAREASEVIRLLEEQIDGLIRFNQASAKWEIKLARADYTPGTMPEVTVDNLVEFVSYSRGTWDNTSNHVRVQFVDRTDEYKQTFAMAQDTANVRIQDVDISVTKSYPGVMDRTQANSLAWRDLRALSYPLAKASLVVDRTFWDFLPGDVIEFTHAYLGLARLPMRITSMDFGELENNRIRIEVVQDVFYTATPSFSDPTSTNWTSPDDNLIAYPSDEQLIFEAPRAIVRRNVFTGGALVNSLMAAGRKAGSEITFDLRERHSASTPSGVYTTIGTGVQFVKIGQLNAALNTKSAYPLTTLSLTATPDTQAALIGAFGTPTDTTELGTTLLNLCVVDDEFILVTTAVANGGLVDLGNVYRGVLDSVQADHASGADVFVLMAGSTVSDSALPETDNVHGLLIPTGFSSELTEASAAVVSFTMDKRIRRPYAPSWLSLNGVAWDTTNVVLEFGGTAAEDWSVDTVLRRRDYRLADDGNEIDGLTTDAETLDATFPLAHATDHDLVVVHDPGGTADAILSATISGTTHSLLRITILQALSGAVPTGDLQWTWTASHTDGGETLTSRQSLVHAASLTTALTGQFEFGLLSSSGASAVYTATVNGNYVFTLSSAFGGGSGPIEYRLNAGAWTTLVTYGGTTGTIVGVVATDTIEVRDTATDTGFLKQLDLNAPGAGQNGFAILE